MAVKDFLKKQEIDFRTFTHPPVYTCEQAEKYNKDIRGTHCKNLFLKNKKSKKFYLVILSAKQKLNMKELGKELKDQLRFANESDLKQILNLTPGAVSPFGLINDIEHKTIIVINREVWDSDFVSFHPNINTETLELSQEKFHKYINFLKNELRII